MAASSHYKVVAYEPGAARVIDRATGKKLGFVLQDNWGRWEAFREPGSSIATTKSRATAARHLWETRP